MKLRYNIKLAGILLIGAAAFLTACEEEMDLDLPQKESQLVVDGWITDQAGEHAVTLSYSAPFLGDQGFTYVKGASVTISGGEGEPEMLQERADGRYVTSPQFRAEAGTTYTLNIKFDDQEYEAKTIVKRPLEIDSLTVVYHKKSVLKDEGHYVLFYGQEPAGDIADFYRFKVFKNDTLMNRAKDLVVTDDKYVNGNYLREVEFHGDPFKKDDRIRLETWSLSEQAYTFLREMNIQINKGGMFDSPYANIPTNVVDKKNPSNKNVRGFFGAAAVRTRSVVVK
ncbi:MAG TPA: DUF4249 domain-containing protein [Sphingobacteriaceae bacterium]